tara:strand:- start:2235 stop:2510 length:276 start_codon:yes stop_codon:yes gene_type:complete
MTILEQVKKIIESVAPDKKQDTEAASHRITELMSKILVIGYKSGFQDAATLLLKYAEDHFIDNKDFSKESEEIAIEKLGKLELPEDATKTE